MLLQLLHCGEGLFGGRLREMEVRLEGVFGLVQFFLQLLHLFGLVLLVDFGPFVEVLDVHCQELAVFIDLGVEGKVFFLLLHDIQLLFRFPLELLHLIVLEILLHSFLEGLVGRLVRIDLGLKGAVDFIILYSPLLQLPLQLDHSVFLLLDLHIIPLVEGDVHGSLLGQSPRDLVDVGLCRVFFLVLDFLSLKQSDEISFLLFVLQSLDEFVLGEGSLLVVDESLEVLLVKLL